MTNTNDWTRGFFSGLFVDVQRRFPQQTEQEVDFLMRVLEPKTGERMLDVPCGTGRLSVPLAQRGLAVTGVDGCKEVLDDGRKAATERGLSVIFEQRDMRQLSWSSEFDHAI